MNKKPLGRKNYGSIPHLLGSKLGPGDHHVSQGQHDIATKKAVPNKKGGKRRVIVQEKLDGSNVGVAKLEGEVIPITRAGYHADASPFETHHQFAKWVNKPYNYNRFNNFLEEGERLVGEWMWQAHGLLYSLPHEPFVAFDLMSKSDRLVYNEFMYRIDDLFVTPKMISIGEAYSTDNIAALQSNHGCIEKPEGVIYRIECETKKDSGVYNVEFLCKFVRQDFKPGKYLSGVPVWNSYCGEPI